MIDKDTRVSYNGENRPYLKGTVGKVISLNGTKTSAYTYFMNDQGQEFREWIGIGSLIEEPTDAVSQTIKLLQVRLNEVRSKISNLRREIEEIETDEENIESAIFALQELV